MKNIPGYLGFVAEAATAETEEDGGVDQRGGDQARCEGRGEGEGLHFEICGVWGCECGIGVINYWMVLLCLLELFRVVVAASLFCH